MRRLGGPSAQLILRAFRWTHGHADFADALRDPDLLAAMGPALAGPLGTAGVTASWPSKLAGSSSVGL